MKIIRPFTGTGAVFFPVGLPPTGTCEFASPACLKYCYTHENSADGDYSDYDDEIRISVDEKKEIYSRFMTTPVVELCDEIERLLDGLQTHLLHWFGSGDCTERDWPHIQAVVDEMRTRSGVVQMGFTRNLKFWEANKDILALTIEDEGEAQDPTAIYSVPDYDEQTSKMYSPKYQVRGGYCGPIICRDVSRKYNVLDHYINCKNCHRRKLGCFDRR